MTKSNTIAYFGMDTVERAIAAYFMKHGVNEEVRERLMSMESADEEEFFDMVCDFVEKNG